MMSDNWYPNDSRHRLEFLFQINDSTTPMSAFYESDTAFKAMALMHFAREFKIASEPVTYFENTYFERIDALARTYETHTDVALDLGCGLGASSMLLAERYGRVLASDLSERFIAAAKAIETDGWGAIESAGVDVDPRYRRISADTLSRIRFSVADASEHLSAVEPVDLVLALNLICRLPDLRPFLRGIDRVVKQGGLVIIASPYTFSTEHSPESTWIHLDERGSGVGDLGALLGSGFSLRDRHDISFPFQDYPRRVHLSTSEVTVWERIA